MLVFKVAAAILVNFDNVAAYPSRSNKSLADCRAMPGDAEWPSSETWQTLNESVDGRLIATIPLAYPCHGSAYDSAVCADLKSQWDLPWIQ